jgi:hypothetical protein
VWSNGRSASEVTTLNTHGNMDYYSSNRKKHAYRRAL